MSTTKENLFNITDGPNRNDLCNAFLYAYDGEIGRKLCRFTIVDGMGQKKEIYARIIELSHEDGSGYSYMFKAYYGTPAKDGKSIWILATGYYHARSREGWLRPDTK